MAGDSPEPTQHPKDDHAKGHGFLALTVGSIGVVFGDIGTSPLYAMREALHHAKSGGTSDLAVLGVVSLAFWALLIVVTLKYVVFLMKADNEKLSEKALRLKRSIAKKLEAAKAAA